MLLDNDVFCGNNAEIGVWKARLEEAICEEEDDDRALAEEGNRYQALLSTMHATITFKPPTDNDDESAIAPETLRNSGRRARYLGYPVAKYQIRPFTAILEPHLP